MKAELYKIHKEWWYNNPQSRYQRFCQYCDHCVNTNGEDKLCGWWNTTCYDAARNHCPIPTAGVAMLMEGEATFKAHIEGNVQRKKGGTVVPPSNFQFGTTESPNGQRVTKKTPRPCEPAGAHARKEPLAPTQISHQKCGKTECPYYGHMATYCRICSHALNKNKARHPDMCANLLCGVCDGHACKCKRYVDFIDWCNKI